MTLRAWFFTLFAAAAVAASAQEELRRGIYYSPATNGREIVFVRGNELWRVARGGGVATSLGVWANENSLPKFSPDGKRVALLSRFSGAYDLGTVSIDGGELFRVTHYPRNGKGLMQWLPNGRLLYFTESDFRVVESQLYTVAATGGLPEKVPVPYGADASIEGDWLAYTLHLRPNWYWKHYKGGMAQDIWLYNLRTRQSQQVTKWKGYDLRPMWVNRVLYYLSDEGAEGYMNLWRYDPATKRRLQITHLKGWDIQNPSACVASNEIVFAWAGDIHRLDLGTGTVSKVAIEIPASAKVVAERSVEAGNWIANRALMPDGTQVVVEARGDLWLTPAAGGTPKNLTRSDGVFERDPAVSRDGTTIAFFSDRTGEYQLTLLDVATGAQRTITNFKAGFRQTPRFSPDGRQIAFTDDAGKFYLCEHSTGAVVQFDADPLGQVNNLSWSPDSKLIAYSKYGLNSQTAIWLYDVPRRKRLQVTSGMVGDSSPVFSRRGDHLYYFSLRDLSRRVNQLMDSASVYTTPTVVMDIPLSGEIGEAADLEGRARQLPIPSGRFDAQLWATEDGLVYLRRNPMQPANLQLFTLPTEIEKTILQNAEWFVPSDGSKLLAGSNGSAYVLTAEPDQNPGTPLAASGYNTPLNPVAEWRQIARDVWRLFRDYFYDPNMHGLNWAKRWDECEPLLELCATRDDLNYALGEMISELSVGHAMMTNPGDVGGEPWLAPGTLGVDFKVANGAYRIDRIYQGAPWDPGGRSPLNGTGVKVGDYVLAVNGKPIDMNRDPWSAFLGLAGKKVKITVGANPRVDSVSREIEVATLNRETDLRMRDWIERNRQTVARLSGGKLGYIYLPGEDAAGIADFTRQFYAQTDKEGVVVDARWNTGGNSSDRLIEMLNRPLLNAYHERYTVQAFPIPVSRIPGPKCLLINRVTSSSGENFAFYFRKAGIGKLIGTRTWGGLIGVNGNQSLIDNGFWWVPQSAFFVDQKRWMPEGEGVAPDIEVLDDPAQMGNGRDPQLAAAVRHLLEELRKQPQKPTHPPAAVKGR